MTNKTILGSALVLILIVPMTSLSAYAIAPDPPVDGKQFNIKIAGTSVLSPLVNKWSSSYQSLYPGASIKYQSVGNNNVVFQFTKKTVNFGITDTPLSSTQSTNAAGSLTFPVSVYPIAIVYNLPEFKQSGLKLTGPILADIYLGKISKWNDKRIADLNPRIPLPNQNITPIHRGDSAGTTYTFTDYLSKVSRDWKINIGKGTTVSWRVGPDVPEKSGNDGVAQYITRTPYSISYLDLAYVVKNKITYAAIQNADRSTFVIPTLEASEAAASAVSAKLPDSNQDWSSVSISNAQGKDSYPIVGFNYILTNKDFDKINGVDKDTANTLVHLVYWTITDGQQYVPKMQYAPLPDAIKEIDKRGLSKISYKGAQLFAYDGFAIKPFE